MSEKKDTGRTAKLQRDTAETQISLRLNLDGKGPGEIRTGCGFLDHMLTLFSRHASMDLSVICRGDTDVDFHHSTEDIGICLGKALKEAPSELNLPCHRVVSSNGRTVPDWTEQIDLLRAEGVSFRNDKCVDIKRHLWHPESI